jgi:hypothetical protein
MSTYYGMCERCAVKEASTCNRCVDTGSLMTNYLDDETKERCSDCFALTEGENGEWVCDEVGKPCMMVKECPEQSEDTTT